MKLYSMYSRNIILKYDKMREVRLYSLLPISKYNITWYFDHRALIHRKIYTESFTRHSQKRYPTHLFLYETRNVSPRTSTGRYILEYMLDIGMSWIAWKLKLTNNYNKNTIERFNNLYKNNISCSSGKNDSI